MSFNGCLHCHEVFCHLCGGAIRGNIVSVWTTSQCSTFSDNEQCSSMVGLWILAHDDDVGCVGVSNLKVWKNGHVGIIALDQYASVKLSNVTVAYNHVGISINSLRSGVDHTVEIHHSRSIGTTFLNRGNSKASEQCSNDKCVSYGRTDTFANYIGFPKVTCP